MQNKEIQLAGRPAGLPTAANFRIVDIGTPVPKADEVLLRALYISVDPYLRGRMRAGRSYIPPFNLDEPISSGVVAEVVESKSSDYSPGAIVTANLPWRLYSVAPATVLRKVDPTLAPVTTALGILGMPGLTAYFGLLDIGQPQEGETVVVSGAAGAVGMTVCQLAKNSGCRVVGIAGSDEKNRYLVEELGVDATINYKTTDSLRRALEQTCPTGVDVYFDNVGGDISDAVIPFINQGARLVICGQISMYNLDTVAPGLRPQPYLLVSRALMKGFIISDYAPRFPEGLRQLARWLSEGQLKYAEHIVDGFENTPRALMGLFTGENLGKQLVKID
jgi:NADPH:quinone reductase